MKNKKKIQLAPPFYNDMIFFWVIFYYCQNSLIGGYIDD